MAIFRYIETWVVTGAPELVVWLMVGRITLPQARARGLSYQGDIKILRRFQPSASASRGGRLPLPAK